MDVFDDNNYPGTGDCEKKRIYWPLRTLMKNLKVRKNQPTVKETLKTKIIKKKKRSYCLKIHPLKVATTQRKFLKELHQNHSTIGRTKILHLKNHLTTGYEIEITLLNKLLEIQVQVLEPEVLPQNECLYGCFLSQNEPKKIDEALLDPDWIVAMEEELVQFEKEQSLGIGSSSKG